MALNKFLARMIAVVATLAGLLGFAGTATAQQATGQPVPWQMGLQPAASPIMAQMNDFHNLLLWIITVIAVFVLILMIYVMVKFNRKANPTPSSFTHNTMLEVLWTVIPVAILIVIAVPSMKLLYAQNTSPEADLTIKAIGNSWYWDYEYPDDGFEFTALMVDEADLEPGQPRLLATDTPVVVPVGKVVRVLITANDVIHSWAVPALGVKTDAVPGRLNETWFLANEPGTYYGQCSELCGQNHAFMPIEVKAVSEADYQAWLEMAREEYTRIDDNEGESDVQVADVSRR
jgi:cytochrome c oxidase subunit 2